METSRGREPHSVSLKVLRLSRPSLSQHFPIRPTSKDLNPQLEPTTEGRSDNIEDGRETFSLGHTLTLPPSFGSVYVGEPFNCALCANNELDEDAERQVSNVKLVAEMESPSGTMSLDLEPAGDLGGVLQLRQSVQRNLHFDLREEGKHTLSVSVSYSETTLSKDQGASSGRIRTYRKLYPFSARPCLNVRTKVSAMVAKDADTASQYALEAQVDNLADTSIVLKSIAFNPKPAFKSTSLNWDAQPLGKGEFTNCPVMSPRDVYQVAFLLQEDQSTGSRKEVTRDGRILLGQLGLRWWTEMGEEGFLTTGMLTTKR